MLDRGGIVSVPVIQRTGGRGDIVQFGVGILNLQGNEKKFGVYVDEDPVKIVDLATGEDLTGNFNGYPSPTLIPAFDLINDGETKVLDNNERATFLIPFKIPKDTMNNVEFVYDVHVCVGSISETIDENFCTTQDNFYGDGLYKIYIKVK